MKIRFETTIDDVIAFNRFHFANSPTWRRQVWGQMLIIPGILLLLLLLGYWNLDPAADHDFFALFFGIPVALLSAGWAVGIRWYMSYSLERNTRKFLAEGRNRIMFGWREMELVNNRLILKTELVDSSLDLRAVEKIVSDGDYTYVYIASISAYLIPMTLYPEDEYREFVDELREAWENREAPRPVEDPNARARPADARIAEKPL